VDVTSDGIDPTAVANLIAKLELDVLEACDNLLAAKVSQAEFANRHQGTEVVFHPGDKVLLSTEH